jgi:hypothetical protein
VTVTHRGDVEGSDVAGFCDTDDELYFQAKYATGDGLYFGGGSASGDSRVFCVEPAGGSGSVKMKKKGKMKNRGEQN